MGFNFLSINVFSASAFGLGTLLYLGGYRDDLRFDFDINKPMISVSYKGNTWKIPVSREAKKEANHSAVNLVSVSKSLKFDTETDSIPPPQRGRGAKETAGTDTEQQKELDLFGLQNQKDYRAPSEAVMPEPRQPGHTPL